MILGQIFFLSENIRCDPSLELTVQDRSDDGSQHIFSLFLSENIRRGVATPVFMEDSNMMLTFSPLSI